MNVIEAVNASSLRIAVRMGVSLRAFVDAREDVIKVLIDRRVPALWCHCVTQSASVWQWHDFFEGETVLHALDLALADGSVVALGDDGWEPVHAYDD
jgi:hypothetical protein